MGIYPVGNISGRWIFLENLAKFMGIYPVRIADFVLFWKDNFTQTILLRRNFAPRVNVLIEIAFTLIAECK